MAFAEYDKHDGVGLAHLVRSRQVSPRELLDAHSAASAVVEKRATRMANSVQPE